MTEEQQEVHIVLVSNDPNRAYPALILALGTITMEAKCKLYCTMSGLDVVKRGGASKITMPGAPPLDKYLKDAIDAGVEVTAWGPSKEILAQMGITKGNLEQGVQFEDVVGFLKAALPASKNGGMVLFI